MAFETSYPNPSKQYPGNTSYDSVKLSQEQIDAIYKFHNRIKLILSESGLLLNDEIDSNLLKEIEKLFKAGRVQSEHDKNGDLIINSGTIDTDTPNDSNSAIANRLKVTILKTIPTFLDSLKSKFRGIRVVDSFKLEEELEDFFLLNIKSYYPDDLDLLLLKCSCFYVNGVANIYFYFTDELGKNILVFGDNIEF